jgi:hypothetical protein
MKILSPHDYIQNEIRQKENLSPISGGDEYLDPLNMQAQN